MFTARVVIACSVAWTFPAAFAQLPVCHVLEPTFRCVPSGPGTPAADPQPSLETLRRSFQETRDDLVAWLLANPLDEVVRGRLILKINSVQLEAPVSESTLATDPGLAARDDISYVRLVSGELKIRVGGGYVRHGGSLDAHRFALAHELAHAIDPCDLAWKGFAACWKGVTGGRCESDGPPNERFADWLAARILARRLARNPQTAPVGLKEALAPVCRVEPTAPPSTHPPLVERLQAISETLGLALRCRVKTALPPSCGRDSAVRSGSF